MLVQKTWLSLDQFLLTIPSLLVTLRTTRFNIKKILCGDHKEFVCFVRISEQTATCATYSINWSVFITEVESVYSAVRTVYLNKAVCG